MVKLLLADDEPLTLIGLQSILDWKELGIEIIGTARNGKQAMEMIDELQPDIVITDIKMPLKTGLELCRECSEKYGRLPLFIILTNHEDFEFARDALKHQAVDYMVKLELNRESLSATIRRTLDILSKHRFAIQPDLAARDSIGVLREKFFVRLFNNLFDSDEMYRMQREELGIRLEYSGFSVATCAIAADSSQPQEHLAALFANTMQMVRQTLARHLPCYVVTLDLWHFSIIMCFEQEELPHWQALAGQAMNACVETLRSYLSVSLHAAVGPLVTPPRSMAQSYRSSQRWCHGMTDACPVVFCTPTDSDEQAGYTQLVHSYRSSIRQAFEELDMDALHEALDGIAHAFLQHSDQLLEAMDTACNILYMAATLLPEGALDEIFKDMPEGYRSLYQMRSVNKIARWIFTLRDGCSNLIHAQRQTYKDQIVRRVKAYIQANLDRKLTLHDVAAVFNFSPNYLGRLFSRGAGEGFVEYITAERIAAAKEMLKNGEGRVYEIADRLGFESSEYFSKVFKKSEGLSPREYLKKLEGAAYEPAAGN